MTSQAFRLPKVGRIDRSRELRFSFDGKVYSGFVGDSLASALLVNRVSIIGRSFKYHRPRGLFSAGSEEPNALVTLVRPDGELPNIPATQIELYEGLIARSQNCWPSPNLDLMAVNNILKPIFPAGFYYKTFIWPGRAWKILYEPLIRRAAGLGTLKADAEDALPVNYRRKHAQADIVIVGGGAAGLIAALEAGKSGAKTLLIDERSELGGHLLAEEYEINGISSQTWVCEIVEALRNMDNVTILLNTNVYGRYDGLTFGAVEVNCWTDVDKDNSAIAECGWILTGKQFICATGAIERPIVFSNNDIPGVMLASATRRYINQYGVCPGKQVVLFTNNGDAYATASALAKSGVELTIVDSRSIDVIGDQPVLKYSNISLLPDHVVVEAKGWKRLRGVKVASSVQKDKIQYLPCDHLCVSGGWNSTSSLMTHLGKKLSYDAEFANYIPDFIEPGISAVGASKGLYDLSKTISDTQNVVSEVVEKLGRRSQSGHKEFLIHDEPEYSIEPLWSSLTTGGNPSKSFVDFQNDVTVSDLKLSNREGFEHPEHFKRYTTLGMGTDQGKLSGVLALGVLSEENGTKMETMGPVTSRPLHSPASLGALAGQMSGQMLRPVRRSEVHTWHERNGAVFTQAGFWLRPYYYPKDGEDFDAAVSREVRHVRNKVGMVDVSTLGKIEVRGRDAGVFLDRLYINSFSKMKLNRSRYGVMLREDGMVFDDGTVSRLGKNHYFITVTTVNAGNVLQHMEYCCQAIWDDLDVQFCSVSDNWSALAIAGPQSRQVLSSVVTELDLSNEAFPFLSVGEARIGEIPVRIFRISFSGELAYEVYTPSNFGLEVWTRLMDAGYQEDIVAYGTEAMTVMRAEKGHIAGPEIDGRTTAADLGLSGMFSRKKDFIGRWFAQRESLGNSDRLQLVGIQPSNKISRIRMGAQIVSDPRKVGFDVSLGHVTTSVYSPTLDHYIGLALVKDGRSRIGDKLQAVFPLKSENVEVEIVNSVFYDPEGERMHV